MGQSTLSPHIASVYREELERALDEFAPRIPGIFSCGLESTEYPFYCNYCNGEEIESGTEPCKYLLVDAEKLLDISQRGIELYGVQGDLSFSSPSSSTRRSMSAVNKKYKELEEIFRSVLYRMFVEKGILESWVGSLEMAKTFYKMAKRVSKRVRKGKSARTSDQKNQLALETLRSLANKFDPTDSSILGLLQKLPEADPKKALESIDRVRQSHVDYFRKISWDLEDLCEAERPRLEEIKRMAEIIVSYKQEPKLEEEHRSVKVLTRRSGKIKEGVRKFSFYISEVQKREETITKKRKKHPERERVEEAVKKLEEEMERRRYSLAHASAEFALDAFLAYSDPIQKYRSGQRRTNDLNRRKKELELKKSTVLKRISNLDECINLSTGSPLASIENIGPYCHGEVKKIGIETIRKLKERKEVVEIIEKQVWRNLLPKGQIRLNNWIKRVKIKDLADNIVKLWKISKCLNKVETNISGGKIVKKDGIVKKIKGVEKKQNELEKYIPKLFYIPIEEKKPLKLWPMERRPLDLYIEDTHPIIPPLIEARQIVTPLTAENGQEANV